MTDPALTLSVWRALGEDNRPVATDGGPRISERLAARLGLAYLSFAMPEAIVTGKPHSPVVRLMRRSEFGAMRRTESRNFSDPLAWVVEAQGSWRDGGIVPEEKRQNFSVGVVAFDADFSGPMRYVRDDLGLRVTLVNPDARNPSPRDLASAATYVKRLWKSHLRRSQLPDSMADEIGTITRPGG